MYLNASYTFDNKYTLTASLRNDASNLITDDPKYRYSPFWSVGAMWNMKRENFMRDLTFLDRLDLRVTFGHNGNANNSTSFKPLISLNGTSDAIKGGGRLQHRQLREPLAALGARENLGCRN